MKTSIRLSTKINATPSRIWEVLLQDNYYRQWTALFHPGSYAETDWLTGSEARFLTPEGDGLLSKVLQHEPERVLALEHITVLVNGVAAPDALEAAQWTGLTETYRLRPDQTLEIEQEIDVSYENYFRECWQAALQKIKVLAEQAPS